MVAQENRRNRDLTPAFEAGEQLEIHRFLPGKGERVIMFATASAASSLEPHRMHLQATIQGVGASPHADGRIQRQKDSIDRLLRHVQLHCSDPGTCPQFREAEEQREGTESGNQGNTDAAPEDIAAPAQLLNPDGTGYQV